MSHPPVAQSAVTGDGIARNLTTADITIGTNIAADRIATRVRPARSPNLRLLRQFDAASYPAVRCPIFAVRGDADPLTSDAGTGGWKHCTDSEFTLRTFPGGHSDFLRSPDCTSWIREILSNFT
jgi:surfactin synthase thioesterase subunit